MTRSLPPMNSLRAFEAVARALSFTLAAEELGVSQAAVSQQVKLLEDWLGAKLFRRQGRRVLLTDAGQGYAQAVAKALDGLAAATAALRRPALRKGGPLTVSVLPSFAVSWLIPRLGRFRAAHPAIELRLLAEERLVDFTSEPVDVGIRYGRGVYPALRADRLVAEDIFPVCHPRLLDGANPLREPGDLLQQTLLHDEMREDWRMWFLAAGRDDLAARLPPGLFFTDSHMVLQAALDGQGVALGRSVLVSDALAAGRLVKPFDLALPAEFAYYLICLRERADEPNIKAFRAWLTAELGPVSPRPPAAAA